MPEDGPPERWLSRHCPFTGHICDVTSNRSDRAYLDLNHPSVTDDQRSYITETYGTAPLPLGICSLLTRRQNEESARPWIVCPKRLLDLKFPDSIVPPEVRRLVDIPTASHVRCWWEVKYRHRSRETNEFFEYTFDFLLIPYAPSTTNSPDRLLGPPYVIEVMTSSTRGGGLTEHMIDTLCFEPQRRLGGGVVHSPYTPNYRQVFERMLGQFFAKSEIAEAWGGKTIWLIQDVLLDYIEQTTNFRPSDFENDDEGNVYVLVYHMNDRDELYHLEHSRSLRGHSRPRDRLRPDFTSMLGLGHTPPLKALFETLEKSHARRRDAGSPRNWLDLVW